MIVKSKAKRNWAAVLLIGALLAACPMSAAAVFDQASLQSASVRMQEAGLIQGNQQGDLMVNSMITRAEMVTILVRAFGLEEQAAQLKGYPTGFTDVDGHPWAGGYILAAKHLMMSRGETIGKSDTSFDPDASVSHAETVAFIMKFLGVERDASSSWPDDYIQGAVNAGLISSSDAAAIAETPNAAATRGLVFYFADYAFDNYKNEDGATIYEALAAAEGEAAAGEEPAAAEPAPAEPAGTAEEGPGSSAPAPAVTLDPPTLENIHITYDHLGVIRVNVLYPEEAVTKAVVYDKAENGATLAESGELIIFEAGDVVIPYYSTTIGSSFPEGLTHVYVVIYDADGNASPVVEKPIQ